MSVQGVEKIGERLAELERKVANQISRKGLRAGAKVMLAAERGQAPKESGDIERGLKVRAGKSTKDRISVVVGLAKKWFTGSTFYAAFVELGHKVGSRRLGDKRKQQPANPFEARAFAQAKDAATQAAIQTTLDELEKAIP